MLCEGQSTSAITAMELKYPDDEEKKNSVCISLTVSRTPEDYFVATQSQSKVESLLGAELGLLWMRRRRCYYVHHLTLTQIVHFIWLIATKLEPMKKKIDMCVEQIQNSTNYS